MLEHRDLDVSELDARFVHHSKIFNGVDLHWVAGGRGRPVLLWHGFCETWYCWRKIMPDLADEFMVIAPDMRGYGDSGKPSTGYDGKTLVADFRLLLQDLGANDPLIVAHDMGAPPALLYAGLYPDEVRGLVYLEEPVLTSENMELIHAFNAKTAGKGALWWWKMGLAPDVIERLVVGNEQKFLAWFHENGTVNPSSIEDSAVKEYLRTFTGIEGVRGAFGVYRQLFDTVAQTNPFSRPRSKIKTPILGLGGSRSKAGQVKKMLESVAIDVRGGTVQDCGHFIADEQPEFLLEQIFAFSAEIG
jgi:pimeloyl-ACP methyl ester carboxylesterase